jgi:tetratricopeptide (TPR) repeat protein/predicted Ser/Thr protein kinase
MTGQTISHYRILEKLGQGGMGEVWKAEDTRLGRTVALKFLKHEYTERFEREARAISALNHPNICTLHDVGEHNGEPYLVMEYVEGRPIQGPLPLDQLLEYAIQIAGALESAHSKGIVHRDIKPANVLLTPEGQVKILDFGLAKFAQAGHTETTQTMYAGTPAYMSPEQAQGEELDARTDLYSFGILLHEMATGARPSPSAHYALPPELAHIVQKALESDRSVRYQHAADIRADLKRLKRDTESHPGVAPKPRRRVLWPAVAAVMVLAVLGLWFWRGRTVAPSGRSRAIAVLYFRNLSQDRGLDWLDSGLCEMLTTNLSQVKGMDVLSTERIAAILQRMGKKELNAGLAPEVARTAGAAAFVTGALLRVGADRLRLDVRVQDVSGGQILFSEKVEGENLDAVFKMVDSLTARMAERFLPSRALPAKAPALEEVATSNVEAYRHYQLGVDFRRGQEFAQALKELEEAVRLDPQFALAWFEITFCYTNFGERRKTSEVLEKLGGMESRLPRKSQLLVQGVRALNGYDWEGAGRITEALLAEFPRESLARLNLAWAHRSRDRFDLAAEVNREGVKLDSNDYYLWNQLAYDHAITGDLAAALEVNDRCRVLQPNSPIPPADRADLFFIAGRGEEAIQACHESLELGPAASDYWCRYMLAVVYADQRRFSLAESALREYGRLSKDPLILFFEAYLEEARARLDTAKELYRKAVAQLAAAKRYDAAGQALMALAHVSQVQGDSASALAFARQQKLDGEEYQPISFLEAVAGDSGGAERSLRKYGSACPWVTPAGLQIFRARNRLAAALQRSDGQASRVSASRLPILPETWMPFYEAQGAVLGKDYGSAEHLLRRTMVLHAWLPTTYRWRNAGSPLVTLLCHFYLGQVYEATGKREQAISEYREFLSPFEGSATRLPQIADARAALKRLGAS